MVTSLCIVVTKCMNYKRVKLLITHQLYTYIALWDVYNHDNKYVIIVES